MKKKVLSVIVALLTILGFGQTVAAQDFPIEKKWEYATGILGTDARQGTAFGGKFYIQNKATSKIEIFDKTGSAGNIASSTHSRISKDEAGNIIIGLGSFFATTIDPTAYTFRIIPAAGGINTDLKIDVSAYLGSGRIDYIGDVHGDLLSAEGGRMYLVQAGQTNIIVVTIKNGVQDTSETFSVGTNTAIATEPFEAISSVSGIADGKILVVRRGANMSYYIGKFKGTDISYTTLTAPTAAGDTKKAATSMGSMFKYKGEDYLVYPTGTNYADGFSIMKVSDKSVVYTKAVTKAANGFQTSWVIPEVINDNTVRLYQYFPGTATTSYVAMYEVGDPLPEVYVIGDVEGAGWTANAGIELSRVGDGLYEGTVTATSPTGHFGLATKLGENDGDWTTLNANRYTPANDGDIPQDRIAQKIYKGTDKSWQFSKVSTFEVYVDLNESTITLTDKASALDFTPKWTHSTGVVGTEARQATAMNGKVYVQDKSSSTVKIFDSNGAAGTLASGTSTNIAKDEAGNIIAGATGFAGSVVGSYKIHPADGSDAVALTLNLSGLTQGRMDYLGDGHGNVLSDEGGRIYLAQNTLNKIKVITIKNGVQDVDANFEITAPITFDNGSFVSALPEGKILVVMRGTAVKYYIGTFNGTDITWQTISTASSPAKSATATGATFKLAGADYLVYPTGTNYTDGFSVMKIGGEVVYTKTSTKAANGCFANWVIAEQVNDNFVRLYHYFPGKTAADSYVSMYELGTPPLDPVYVVGNDADGNWSFDQGTALDATKGGWYENEVQMVDCGNGSHYWRIYENLDGNSDSGSWGPGGDVTAMTGTFTKTWHGAVQVPAGLYNVAFNIVSGTYKIAKATDPRYIYVIGDHNGWDYDDTTYRLTLNPDTGLYEGEINFAAPSDWQEGDTKLNKWLIYERTGQYFSWGVAPVQPISRVGDYDPAGPKAGTLVAGSVTPEETYFATYTFSFNLATGEYVATGKTDDPTTGVDEVEVSTANVVADKGVISVIGDAKNIEIYNTSGMLISKNQAEVNVIAGVYLVKVDGKVSKVLVK